MQDDWMESLRSVGGWVVAAAITWLVVYLVLGDFWETIPGLVLIWAASIGVKKLLDYAYVRLRSR